MTLKEFVDNNDVDYSSDPVGIDYIPSVEKAVGVSLGGELIKYIVKYGYLGFENIEFYGVNYKQKLDSDMIKQTQYLHKYYPKTAGYVAIENQGEGHYHIVDSDDTVYEYVSSADQIICTNKRLLSFILERFQQVSEYVD